jgi:hypothetical protein
LNSDTQVSPDERSIGELVSHISEQMSQLVREEIRLAQTETKQKARLFGLGGGLFGAAGLLSAFGFGLLVAAAVLAIDLVLPGWAAALIVAGVLLVMAGGAALLGRSAVAAASPPMPTEAAESVQRDVAAIKEGMSR